jgi:LacI family transcriptional regulator
MEKRVKQELLNAAVSDVKEPLHSKLRQQLRKLILDKFEHNQRFFSERELLRKFKISQLTVRRSLTDLVQEGCLINSARRGYFVCKKTEIKSVGAFIPAQPSEVYGTMPEFLDSIASECRARDYPLHVYYTHPDDSVKALMDGVRDNPLNERLLLCRQPLGVLVKLNNQLEKAGYTTIALGSGLESEYTGRFVGIDHECEVNLVIDHLLGLGHEQIMFLINEPESLAVIKARLAAIKRRIARDDLKGVKITWCGTKLNEDSFAAAHREMQKIVSLKPRPTAIVPISGGGAWAAFKFLILNNFKIPKQFSLVSFDDVSGSDLLPIPLTSVRMDMKALVEPAVESLWSNQRSSPLLLVKPHLVIRESTGRPS